MHVINEEINEIYYVYRKLCMKMKMKNNADSDKFR